jgi:hypothetical protein
MFVDHFGETPARSSRGTWPSRATACCRRRNAKAASAVFDEQLRLASGGERRRFLECYGRWLAATAAAVPTPTVPREWLDVDGVRRHASAWRRLCGARRRAAARARRRPAHARRRRHADDAVGARCATSWCACCCSPASRRTLCARRQEGVGGDARRQRDRARTRGR